MTDGCWRPSGSASTGWWEAAGRSGLGALVERIVDDHDYDLALLANPYGPRRLANVRKLARLAREFEALRGPDLEGFLETVEVRQAGSRSRARRAGVGGGRTPTRCA